MRDVVPVVAGRVRQRAELAPAGHAAVDEARISREAGVGAEAEPLGHAGPEALDQRVGRAISLSTVSTPSGFFSRRRSSGGCGSSARTWRGFPGIPRFGLADAVDAHDVGADARRAAWRSRAPGRCPRARRSSVRREVPWVISLSTTADRLNPGRRGCERAWDGGSSPAMRAALVIVFLAGAAHAADDAERLTGRGLLRPRPRALSAGGPRDARRRREQPYRARRRRERRHGRPRRAADRRPEHASLLPAHTTSSGWPCTTWKVACVA